MPLWRSTNSTWPVAVLCEVLEVSRSGFYAYVQRHATARRERRRMLWWRG